MENFAEFSQWLSEYNAGLNDSLRAAVPAPEKEQFASPLRRKYSKEEIGLLLDSGVASNPESLRIAIQKAKAKKLPYATIRESIPTRLTTRGPSPRPAGR